jgi:transposase
MSVYVGMDVHRKRSQVAIVDAAGVPQRNRNLPNDPAKLVPVLGALPPGTPVAFEAAYGWGWLVELLEELDLEPHLVHPSRCKAIASARLKNDKVDAATLAQLLRADLLPEAWIAPSATRDLRALLRHRAALVRLSTSLKNRVHAVLADRGIGEDRGFGPVLGARGWATWSCHRSRGQSWRTAVGCWTPWPPPSGGWNARSARSPSPTHGSRRSWSCPGSASSLR